MYIVSNLHNNFEKAIICSHFTVEEQIQSNWVACQGHTERILSHTFTAPSSVLGPTSLLHKWIELLSALFLVNFLCNLKVNFHLRLLQNMFYIPPLYGISLSLSYTQHPVFPFPSIFTAPLPLSTGNHNFFFHFNFFLTPKAFCIGV